MAYIALYGKYLFKKTFSTVSLAARTMMTPTYEDDESHAIPYLGNLDVELTSSAGVRLGIVIASPLQNDERSKRRLVRKLENYVREFSVLREQWSDNNQGPMKAWLYIKIHPESDPEMLQVIADYRRWIESNSISLVISECAP